MGDDHRGQEAEAVGQRHRQEERDRSENLRDRERDSERGRIDGEARVQEIRDQRLENESAAERVQREQRGQLSDDRSRHQRRACSPSRRRGHGRRKRAVGKRLEDRASEEHHEERAPGGDRSDQRRPQRGGSVADQVVEAQHPCALPGGDGAGHDHLLHGEERPGLAGADGDVAEHRRQYHQPRFASDEQEQRGQRRKPG